MKIMMSSAQALSFVGQLVNGNFDSIMTPLPPTILYVASVDETQNVYVSDIMVYGGAGTTLTGGGSTVTPAGINNSPRIVLTDKLLLASALVTAGASKLVFLQVNGIED